MNHERSPFDVLALTAADDAQARGYRAQLTERARCGLLPSALEWHVFVDPGQPQSGQRRVGSGGSTLAVLAELAALSASNGGTFVERLAGRNVLIVHSGGESRRLPAYAALGKIFLPMPCEVRPPHAPPWQRYPAALFDLLWQLMAELPLAPDGQIVVCSGDVLPVCDFSSLHDAVNFSQEGITGLAFAATPQIARHHGVYLTDAKVAAAPWGVRPVTHFLQKPSVEQMQQSGAIDANGLALVDTGVLRFSLSAAASLLHAAGVECSARGIKIGSGLYKEVLHGRVPPVDLYREIALAWPPHTAIEDYLGSVMSCDATPAARRSLSRFFNAMQKNSMTFNVAVVQDGEFFHVGTTRDLLTKFNTPGRTARRFGFKPNQLENSSNTQNNPTIFNCAGDLSRFDIAGTAYLENCELNRGLEKKSLVLENDNVLVGVRSHDPGASGLTLPAGVGLVYLPLNATTGQMVRVPALFGANDDNKATLESGACTFLGRPLQHLLDAGIEAQLLWPQGSERSVWTARLWLVPDAAHTQLALQALRLLLEIVNPRTAPARRGKTAEALVAFWREHTRLSWAELITTVNHSQLLNDRQTIAAYSDRERIPSDLLQHDNFPAAEACARLQRLNAIRDTTASRGSSATNTKWLADFVQELNRRLPQLPPLTRARLLQTASMLADEVAAKDRTPTNKRAETFESAAFAAVAGVVESAVELPHAPTPATILHDQAVWVTAPARIDFAGGWSDTPPICIERGGTVLNAAVTLNRQYPVQVVAKLNEDSCIRLTSIDLGRQEIYRSAAEINSAPDLDHWSSLARMALVVAGIVPEYSDGGKNHELLLRQWLEVLGGGLDLTLFSGLPKGSGLGTSSILGAATLACLARVLGQQLSPTSLITQTSLLEQRMTSGGGWQDQVGGIVPGVKLSRTAPGVEQIPSLQWTIFGGVGPAERELQRRMLLYFTGHKRLAKNILQNVVKRYLAREPEVLRIVTSLKQGAEEAKLALEAGDFNAFATRVAQYWQLKKAIDPESTNDAVESILKRVQKYTAAASLCGAGGGGFMLLIARDEDAAGHIRRILKDSPPNAHARFFDFEIDNQGLAVTVL